MAIKSYRDLTVWRKGMDLVVEVYRLAKKLPAEERYGLTSQMTRAAVSIPANIAEGHGRVHRKEYAQHLSIARGSLMELETHLAIAVRLDYLEKADVLPVWDLAQETGKLLNGLLNALRNDPQTRRKQSTPDALTLTPDP